MMEQFYMQLERIVDHNNRRKIKCFKTLNSLKTLFAFTAIVILNCNIAYTQVCIEYESNNVFSLDVPLEGEIFPRAKIQSTLCLYQGFSTWTDDSIYVESFEGSDNMRVFVKSNIIYKVFNEKISYYRRITNTSGEYFKSSRKNLNWQISYNVSKYILGFKCYKATARSKNIEIAVWFTEELIYSDGPEFYGYNLPGIILELNTSRNGKNYKAIDIRYNSSYEKGYLPKFKNEHLSTDEINDLYLGGIIPDKFIIKKGYELNKWIDISVSNFIK